MRHPQPLTRSSAASRFQRKRVVGGLLASGVVVVASLTALTWTDSAHAAPRAAAPRDADRSHDVVANLFEWNWASVAKECTTVLGPKGYGAVQVAPPQDSLSRSGPAPVHPWWEVYQPVTYQLTSRMGTEAQFRSMVSTCRGAGVEVIVDAVINHMTGQGDVSYGGVHYTKYAYAGRYTPANFHRYPTDCPVPPPAGSTDQNGTIADFNNYRQVTKCELVSLSDLRTETSYVRDQLAGYLNKLIGYGVSGFRVDAAKHIPAANLSAIESRLDRTADGTRAYIALEVPPGGPGKLSPWAFQAQGSLLGFDYAAQIHDAFKSYVSPSGGSITDLQVFGSQSGLLPGNKELVFVENHDSERNGSTLSYQDGATNTIATEFMLAWPHGRPEVYASFAFANPDDSPPANAQGFITGTDCGSAAWVCTDRSTGVANMVGWHNYVGHAPVRNWYDDSVNLIAFSRGHRGWIAVNHEATAQTHTFSTGLSRGIYCDIIHGNVGPGSCSGPTVSVDSHGKATVTVPAQDAVAFDAAGLQHR
jgi:alpha-amylase